uniref:Uncharacterized protein n=1 Tax=Globodera rostochiensis TaxID=31243 RepID=A0A914HQN4_GLORO
MDTAEQAKLAALRILEMGPRVAIVTLGPKGAIVAQRGTNNGHVNIGEVLAPKVTAVDKTPTFWWPNRRLNCSKTSSVVPFKLRHFRCRKRVPRRVIRPETN